MLLAQARPAMINHHTSKIMVVIFDVSGLWKQGRRKLRVDKEGGSEKRKKRKEGGRGGGG